MRLPRAHELTAGTILKHYKGGTYKILHIARDTISGTTVVVYEYLDTIGEGREIWVRPVDEFQQNVTVQVPRFYVEDDGE